MRAFRDACVVLATVLCAVEGYSPVAIAACAEGSDSSLACETRTDIFTGLRCGWIVATSTCVPQAERRCREWDEPRCSFYSEIETGRECMWDASSAMCVLSPPLPSTPAPATRTPPAPIDLNETADKLATGIIVVIAIGSVVAIVLCALCVFCLVRTSSNAKAPPQQEMHVTPTAQQHQQQQHQHQQHQHQQQYQQPAQTV
eukprot:TRINITY_DN282_c0_g1_i6.p1 TRINITY_DN282_c0_g1~~TRINITY_DN282_c0_g1_i6.p1  ORF type:complete len:222 (+),score=51.03 TRINITY_DN282_c0_g1_i6:66-668(+)